MSVSISRRSRHSAANRIAAVSVVFAAVLLLVRPRRVVVSGMSMEPTLLAGDRLLVGRTRPIRAGDVVALRDPTNPRHVIVKRVTAVRRTEVIVRGDNPWASIDSRSFGPVPRRAILGTVVRRYAPAGRAGRL
jgi:nickel-type superoxide dismutase maturation protease